MNKLSASEDHHHHKMFSGALNAIKRVYKTATEGVTEAQRMRRDYGQLKSMSDRDLEDIGISRGDIPAIVAGTYVSNRRAWPCARNVIQIGRREGPRSPGVNIQPGGRRSKQMSDQTKTSDAKEIDVRSLVPARRHAKIFELVNELIPGASFILVNDHDPKPLYYQLEAEYPKQFSWDYLDRGPDVWRVQIGKPAQAA